MATNELYKYGDWISLPVPADLASGAPVLVGHLAGVAQTKEGEGGNADGFASIALTGAFNLSVTGAIASVGLPVYITAAHALTTTATANHLFGHALATKGAGAGVIPVRLVGNSNGASA
jgi:predicted RecA/RadA family phage recombinase